MEKHSNILYCQCGNCRDVFPKENLKKEVQNLYGIKVNHLVCPKCGAPGYSVLDDSILGFLNYIGERNKGDWTVKEGDENGQI